MKVNFSFNDADDSCKKKLEDYVTEEKLNSLTRLLQHGNLDVAELDIRTEYRPHHNNFSIKIDLKIPRHILVSEETSYNLTEAFDLAFDKIVVQMRKIEEIRHHK
jgi:ribosome-associated translation inhibitor RaiA